MNNKRRSRVFLALMLVGNMYKSNAADQEQKSGFLPLITPSKLQSEQAKTIGSPQCVLRIALPGMPAIKQVAGNASSPSESSALESSPMGKRSPRYDGLPKSPVLFAAGSRIMQTSPRLAYSGIKLVPLASTSPLSPAIALVETQRVGSLMSGSSMS